MLIREFIEKDTSDVNALIRGIQQTEQGLALDQPELRAIPEFYQINGNFWVALDESVIVGTVALLLLGNRIAKLGKMFVAPSHRGPGKGVAKALLATASEWAGQQGVTAVCLETSVEPCAAHSFYLKNGFLEVSPTDLPPEFKVCPYPSRYFIRKLGGAV